MDSSLLSSSSLRPLSLVLFEQMAGEAPVISVLSDSASPQNTLLRRSEFDQDHKMIMFSLQVDCELNVSDWKPRSIAFPLFVLKGSSPQQRPLTDTLSVTQHRVLTVFWIRLVGKISSKPLLIQLKKKQLLFLKNTLSNI